MKRLFFIASIFIGAAAALNQTMIICNSPLLSTLPIYLYAHHNVSDRVSITYRGATGYTANNPKDVLQEFNEKCLYMFANAVVIDMINCPGYDETRMWGFISDLAKSEAESKETLGDDVQDLNYQKWLEQSRGKLVDSYVAIAKNKKAIQQSECSLAQS